MAFRVLGFHDVYTYILAYTYNTCMFPKNPIGVSCNTLLLGASAASPQASDPGSPEHAETATILPPNKLAQDLRNSSGFAVWLRVGDTDFAANFTS